MPVRSLKYRKSVTSVHCRKSDSVSSKSSHCSRTGVRNQTSDLNLTGQSVLKNGVIAGEHRPFAFQIVSARSLDPGQISDWKHIKTISREARYPSYLWLRDPLCSGEKTSVMRG